MTKLSELVAAYQGSRDYQSLAPATKRNTEKALNKVSQFMDRPLERMTKGRMIALMDQMPPGSAYVFATRMKALFRFGIEREMLAVNPMDGAKLPKTGEYRPWTPEELEAMLSKPVHERVKLAIVLAYYTAQRISDVLRMKWSDITDQGAIYVRQKKTGAELFIHLHPVLKAALDQTPRRGEYIVSDTYGQKYEDESFRRKFARERDKLGLPKDLHFHGIRKTIASVLAAKGASTEQIKAVGGWKTARQVDHYCRGADQYALAKGALAKL